MKPKISKPKIKTNNKAYIYTDSPLYKLKSKKRLVKILLHPIKDIYHLRQDRGNYSVFTQKGKNGKPRQIQKPCLKLDILHTRIASLLTRIATPAYLHSGKKEHSNVSNANAHRGSSHLLTTDVKSFFPSTTRNMVFSFFYSVMKCSSDIADILADVCTCHGHVPTGSRISMPLAFWANIRMFDELHSLSEKHSATMTLYVDDVTFSGDQVNDLFRSCARKVIAKHGHTMHPAKTVLYKPEQPKLVTGVVVQGDQLKVRNDQHLQMSCEVDQWKAIKDLPNASHTSIMSKLIGRLYSMGVIEEKFKAKALTVKKATAT